ncbi:MAG: hypothetical protein WAW37_05860 [Syntrophobacteraceae bacterium]
MKYPLKNGGKKRPGRPKKFTEDMPERAYELCRACGLTDKQLSVAFGISVKVLYEWKIQNKEFRESVKRGKDEFDSEVVEKSLLRRALGYKITETTKEPVLIKNGEGENVLVSREMLVTKTVRKHVHPDTTAIIFWLKNRSPGRWRDKTESKMEWDVYYHMVGEAEPHSTDTEGREGETNEQ